MPKPRQSAASAIGFRRDVTWFLSALVGFLVILILVLVTQMQVLVNESERAAQQYRAQAVDAALRSINNLPPDSGSATIEGALVGVRVSTGVGAIELRTRTGNEIRVGDLVAGDRIERTTRLGRAAFVFDTSAMDALRRRLFWTTAISFASIIIGSLLLLFYVRRIARPIERLLEEATALEARPDDVEETEYIIAAFRGTIASLKDKEVELQGLHAREKARADDLELVSNTLTRSLTSGFLALNAAGELLQMNEAGRKMLDLTESRIGSTALEALGPTEFARTLTRAWEGREALSRVEVPVETPAGIRMIGLSSAPLADDGGRFLGLLALFADLTPVRELETRLREMRALADLGEMAAGIAHEFRNSLSTIQGYLKLAGRSAIPPEAEARIRAAQEEAVQLGSAVTALLGFGSPMAVRPAPVAIGALLESTVGRLGPQAEGVELRLACDALGVNGDAALLSRAFENVIRNAIEAVQRGGRAGRVDVRCSGGEQVSIEIDDDGVGVDPAEIPSLFLPFRSGRPGGFGLGLALARKIVVLHGGSIRMEARREGGVRVVIELPPAAIGA